MGRLLAILVCLVMLVGCSSDEQEPVIENPDNDVALGEPDDVVPDAVRSFRCEADEDGRWLAAGTLANSADAEVTYRVVVFLGSGEGAGQRTEVGPIAAESTADFEFALVPPGDPQATCRIHVSRIVED